MTTHRAVLVEAVIEGLAVKASGRYIDATYGRGGHSAAILEALGEKGLLLAIDRDMDAVRDAQTRFGSDPRFRIEHGTFARMEELLHQSKIGKKVDGVLMDLGVSSPQLEDPARGFSFQLDGPLDMRMDATKGITAAKWLATASERDISRVIKRYGEEPEARRIARAIVKARRNKPLTHTRELSQCIAQVLPRRRGKLHPATRTFQAIRIFINDELAALERALEQAVEILGPEGRLCVISFHSLEDRIVKRFFRSRARPDPIYAGLPDVPAHARPTLKLIGKPVRPSAEEIAENPRARSAVLRVAERVSS